MADVIPNVVISMPSQLFTLARKFQAASNGKIFIGKIDSDPTIPENQIQVYLENEDGTTVPVSQPLIINQAGYPVYNGQIAKFVTVQGHSMAVYDSYGSQQFYYPNVLKYDPDQFENRFMEQISSDGGAAMIGASPSGNVQQYISGFTNNAVLISTLGLSDTDHAFNATHLDKKLRELEAEGIKNIVVDKEYSFDTGYDIVEKREARRVGRLTNFYFYGRNKMPGLYNVAISDADTQTPVCINGSKLEVKAKSPGDIITVVLFGDSISGDWADSNSIGVTQWECIKSEMRRQNPGVKFHFVNRSIGGQTWLQAHTKPTYFPPEWYTDTSLDWTYYVVQPVPDIVIFAFGMNDSAGFNFGTMAATVTTVKSALPDSAMVIIPCLTPARATDYNDGYGFDGEYWQNGRMFAAGAERTYAEHIGASVWDLNRYFSQCRDGRDIVSTNLMEIDASPQNGAFTAPECIDFSFEFTVSGWDKNNTIYINCGGDEEDNIYIGGGENNGFAVTAVTEYIGSYFSSGETAVKIPSSPFTITVTVIQNECSVTLSRKEPPITDMSDNILIASFKLVRHGGMFSPKIGYAGFDSGPIISIRAMIGLPKRTMKTVTDADMWGIGDASPTRKYPFGGNGINHPSSKGLSSVILPVLESQDLRISFTGKRLSVSIAYGAAVLWKYPSAFFSNGILTLSGDLKSSSGLIATIIGYNKLGVTSDIVFSATGNDGTGGWGTRILRLKPDGGIYTEVGDVSAGVLFDNSFIIS